MAPRPPGLRRFIPRVRTTIALTWAGTQWANPVLLNGDVAFQDLSSNLDTRLGRNITNAVVQTVRGQVSVTTTATALATFTRMIMSMGIVWADSSFIDPADALAGSGSAFPNPLSESMKWIWRHNLVVTGMNAGTAGVNGNFNLNNGSSMRTIDVHVKVRRKQPSLNHRLYFFWAKTLPAAGFDANIAATPGQLTGAVNLLMKTP